jgi:hypothetical protein
VEGTRSGFRNESDPADESVLCALRIADALASRPSQSARQTHRDPSRWSQSERARVGGRIEEERGADVPAVAVPTVPPTQREVIVFAPHTENVAFETVVKDDAELGRLIGSDGRRA